MDLSLKLRKLCSVSIVLALLSLSLSTVLPMLGKRGSYQPQVQDEVVAPKVAKRDAGVLFQVSENEKYSIHLRLPETHANELQTLFVDFEDKIRTFIASQDNEASLSIVQEIRATISKESLAATDEESLQDFTVSYVQTGSFFLCLALFKQDNLFLINDLIQTHYASPNYDIEVVVADKEKQTVTSHNYQRPLDILAGGYVAHLDEESKNELVQVLEEQGGQRSTFTDSAKTFGANLLKEIYSSKEMQGVLHDFHGEISEAAQELKNFGSNLAEVTQNPRGILGAIFNTGIQAYTTYNQNSQAAQADMDETEEPSQDRVEQDRVEQAVTASTQAIVQQAMPVVAQTTRLFGAFTKLWNKASPFVTEMGKNAGPTVQEIADTLKDGGEACRRAPSTFASQQAAHSHMQTAKETLVKLVTKSITTVNDNALDEVIEQLEETL